MEVFDIVNEKDKIVGRASREECHSNPKLIHRTAHFTLVDRERGRILLTQRSFKKETDPGKLCFLGEHVGAGESYEQALKRGVVEGLGLAPQVFEELAHHIFKFPNQTEFVRFFVVDWGRENIDYDKEEIIKVEWLNPETLVGKKSEYSDMTRHWVDNVDWKKLALQVG